MLAYFAKVREHDEGQGKVLVLSKSEVIGARLSLRHMRHPPGTPRHHAQTCEKRWVCAAMLGLRPRAGFSRRLSPPLVSSAAHTALKIAVLTAMPNARVSFVPLDEKHESRKGGPDDLIGFGSLSCIERPFPVPQTVSEGLARG
jgi:hypothetical protein